MTSFQFRTVPHIVSAPGAAPELARHAAPALKGARRLLVVTDKGVMGLGLLNSALEGLKADGFQVHVYDKVVADPPESVIEEAVTEGRGFGAEAVIGFGGGSPMDTAKVVALLLGSEQPLADMYGMDRVKGPRLPLILIPTTAGTGSEVTSVAVITTGATSKRGIAAAPLYADMAVLDADLTLGLPKHITAATGIDAMVHAIEAFTGKRFKNPVSDALALAALRMLHANLERV
ncbi:MAG TPA: alcohol dehydrogenase, partial [Oceanicaulis sp.]|nr:alcohol dehydrogenase [Oceanicaulis sp.]